MKDRDVTPEDILKQFRVNRHALRYFGILCFEDLPGFFPQLENGHLALLPQDNMKYR